MVDTTTRTGREKIEMLKAETLEQEEVVDEMIEVPGKQKGRKR